MELVVSNVSNTSFVTPHFIEELGCEGLTLHEVARSLGIEFKHAKECLEKNLEDYTAVEVSTQQAIQEVTGHSYARTIKSYVLSTEDAKFFVSGYNNEIGKSYRKFLIQCEKALLQTRQPVKPPTQLELAKQVVQLLEMQEHQVKVLTTSQRNNANLTHENKKLKLAMNGFADIMSINQYVTALQLTTRRNTNSLVARLKKMGLRTTQKMIAGCQWPTTFFGINDLEANKQMIIDFCEYGNKTGNN